MVKQLPDRKHKRAVKLDGTGSWWAERARRKSLRRYPDFDADSQGAINRNIEGKLRNQSEGEQHKLDFLNCFHYINSAMDGTVCPPPREVEALTPRTCEHDLIWK